MNSYVPYMSPSNSLYKGSMDPKSVTLRSSFVVFVGFFIMKRYAIVLTSLSYRIYMIISWWVVVVIVMMVVFTSDDDQAQLQAYVMTVVLLRGCRRVNKFFRFLLRYNLAKNIDHQ